MKLSTIAPLGLLIGAGIWAARRPEVVKESVSDALAYLEETTQPLARRLEREVIPQARKALKDSSRAAKPLLSAAGEFAEDWLERGQEFAQQATEWGEESAHDLAERGSKAVRGGRDWLGRELKAREVAQKKEQVMDAKLVRELAMKLDRQEKAIRSIGNATRPRAAGLPLGWMLLSAGAYYLYKNPDVLHKALDAIKGYIPADASKHLEGAADAVKDGVDRVSRGASPMDAAKDAAGEVGSELGKAAGDAKRQASDIAKDVGDAAKGAVKDVQKAANA